jgi:hypothetical protein
MTPKWGALKRGQRRLQNHEREGDDGEQQGDGPPKVPAARGPRVLFHVSGVRGRRELPLHPREGSECSAGQNEGDDTPQQPARLQYRNAADDGRTDPADQQDHDPGDREHAIRRDDSVDRRGHYGRVTSLIRELLPEDANDNVAEEENDAGDVQQF